MHFVPIESIGDSYESKLWMAKNIQQVWEDNMILSPTNMTTLYLHIRKFMMTSLKGLDVQWLLNLSLESTDMCLVSLCRVELTELKTVCENWNRLLTDTPRDTSTLLQPTETTSTFLTYAGTADKLVGAPSSFEAHFGAKTEDVDFVGLLEQTTCNQEITSTYCDTYLRAADASISLEGSEKMSDYLIDINIYKRKDIWDKPKGDYWRGATARCRGTFPANHQAVTYASKIVTLLGQKMMPMKKVKKIRKTPGFNR
ncbi:uncharacterized protein LOC115034944 [Acyrthosiphon pisum]|uniref:Uncharacterized protein n=1 Tax=Acyrthosiphon pisum TaxID=7029 RepID=A0A8R2NV74_ACYPI|nr:uncharacterized protein LOC115034944 [Acyrthosiphon pisum]